MCGNPVLLPPDVPGFRWHSLKPEDALPFYALQKECALLDQSTPVSLEELTVQMKNAAQTLQTDSLCAVGADGRLAAAAWVTFDDSFQHELRAYLAEWVDPSFRERGLGRYLVRWMEARASVKFTEWQDERPRILRLDVTHQDRQVFRLYEEMGYHFAVAEATMRRALGGLPPEDNLPAELGVVSWSAEQAALFHATYLTAFRDRPGFPAWDLETWRGAFTTSEDFRPDLSLLVRDGAVGVAYAVCVVEEGTGWVLQIGVNTDYRRRGLGAGLLAELLRRFRALGLVEAALDVNLNNEGARRLYTRMGFVSTGICSSYRKTL